jgi:hypothetical protein
MDKEIGSLSNADIDCIRQQEYLHHNDGDVICKNGIVVILDVLGWKNKADIDSINTYVGLINRLRISIIDGFRRCSNSDTPDFAITTLSDTIAILLNSDSPYYEVNIFQRINKFIVDALECDFMFRGAISKGEYYTNINNNIFVGQTFYEAASYAEATEWAGVIITNSLANDLLKENTIQDLREWGIVQYDNIPFKTGPDKKIKPTKDKLVLAPPMMKKIILPSKEKVILDYKKLYRDNMNGESHKLDNTIKFIEYLENNIWN